VNAKDKQDLELVHYRLDELDKRLQDMRTVMRDDHKKVDQSLSFIKENLFNPNEGLWAETKQNTQFRVNSQKWRGVVGTGFVALIIDKVWGIFT
tara:strand:+ start:375 stop:656 length:282 start_codon:yes stop_codon:yes gene_type:complete